MRLNRPLTSLLQSGSHRAEPQRVAPAHASAAAIDVHVATTVEDFAALAPAWNRLHAEAQAASVFNSWLWLYEWWLSFRLGRPLRILVARQAGEVVGILPLYVDAAYAMRLPLRLLRLVGTGGATQPDDLGPVLARGHEADTVAALARAALDLPDVDVWHLADIDPRSPLPGTLEAAAREANRAPVVTVAERIAFLELPATWEAYLASQRRGRRWQLRRSRRRLVEEQSARFFVWDDAARLDWAVDRLAALHRMRWAAAGSSRSFSSAAYVQFHRTVIKSFFPRGWLRLYCLEAAGQIRAMLYCYRFRRRVYLMQAGFDPRFSRYGIGKVLLGYALEHAIGEGNEIFDFLRGQHRYKEELATGHRNTATVRAFAATPAALAYRLRHVWLPGVKARVLKKGRLRMA